MEKTIPVIAAHVDCSLKNLAAILLAGGKRDDEIVVENYVLARSGVRQAKAHKLRAIADSDGNLVCYQRRRMALHRGPRTRRHEDPRESWQKTPSGDVHAMQLKVGKRGRRIPAGQRVQMA